MGAVAGGILGGAAMDGLTTGIDSALHGEVEQIHFHLFNRSLSMIILYLKFNPNGSLAIVEEIVR